MASNTVGSIVNRAIDIAQLDSSFLELARQFYNIVLQDHAGSANWPYYRVEASQVAFVSGQTSYDLPTDYVRSDTCYLVDSNGNRRSIRIMSKYNFDRLKGSTLSGDPTIAYINLTGGKIVFNSAPSATRYYVLTYFRKPEEIDETGGNDNDETDSESPMYLLYKIIEMLLEYTDDERAMVFGQKAEKILKDDLMVAWDEDNDSVIELGATFRPGRYNNRSGGFSF